MTDKTTHKTKASDDDPKPVAAKAASDTPPEPAKPKLTKQQQEAADALAKLKEASVKAEQEANDTAAKINANLIKDGSPNRIIGTVRDGEPKYFWGNFVPTRALTDEELAAAQGMKA